jgi:hypothetical protein
MYEPDIEKLRRFALTVAIVLLIYSAAGIPLKPDSVISVMGLPFKADLLPYSLVIASIISIIRFYYYGFMLKKSPCRLRRDAVEGLVMGFRVRVRGGKFKGVPLYFNFGPINNAESLIWDEDKKRVQQYVDDFPNIFPKFLGGRASATLRYDQARDEDGEPAAVGYTATVSIPRRCRLAAIAQDIDYSSPMWLNFISLAIYFCFRY